MNLEQYSRASEFINSGDPDVVAFAQKVTAGAADGVARAVKLYYTVRDEIVYDPYYAGAETIEYSSQPSASFLPGA